MLRETFDNEVKLTLFKNYYFNAQLSQAIDDNLWVLQLKNDIEHVFGDFLEVRIPFDDLKVHSGEFVEFFIIQGPMGIVDEFYPQNDFLSVQRPL